MEAFELEKKDIWQQKLSDSGLQWGTIIQLQEVQCHKITFTAANLLFFSQLSEHFHLSSDLCISSFLFSFLSTSYAML